jgi:hypothetical protein
MKRTFEFHDDKSGKFWSIEKNGKEFTVFVTALRIDDCDGEDKNEMHNEHEGVFDENVDRNVSVSLNQQRKSLQLFPGKNCSGKVFFEFKLGGILSKCIALANEQGIDFPQEQARWLNEAISLLPNIYKNKRGIVINVPAI